MKRDPPLRRPNCRSQRRVADARSTAGSFYPPGAIVCTFHRTVDPLPRVPDPPLQYIFNFRNPHIRCRLQNQYSLPRTFASAGNPPIHRVGTPGALGKPTKQQQGGWKHDCLFYVGIGTSGQGTASASCRAEPARQGHTHSAALPEPVAHGTGRQAGSPHGGAHETTEQTRNQANERIAK